MGKFILFLGAFLSALHVALLGAALLLTTPALAQSAEHAAAVKAAQASAFVRAQAANGCPAAGEDFLGWPGKLVLRCEYKQGELTGLAYVLDIQPEAIAQWIETACAEQMSGVAACFDRVLACGVKKSGMVFPVSGNVIDSKNGALLNMFYRNGMAVGGAHGGKPGQIPLDEQEQLARLPDGDIPSVSSGAVRYWRTLPYQFAVKAIELGVPGELNTKERRQHWFDLVREEMLASLSRPRSKLLIAWMAAHPITLRTGECPDDRDP